ncbi:O-antigen ligase family protein [Microbacterium sp. PA5]|uniref:O-antigen ligase family protein n=1 Tax=Microbacterium sp. PA5 TaxID=3416654 RepID=UPI003CE99FDC
MTNAPRIAPLRFRDRPVRERLVYCLVVAVVAACGADRIDLGAGALPVTVTPSLILYVLAVAAAVAVLWTAAPRLERFGWWGISLAGTLVIVAGISALVAGAPSQGLRRVALLALTIAGVWSAIILARRLQLLTALRIGAWVALGAGLALTVVQVASWSPAVAGVPHWLGPLYVTAPTYGPLAPRPSGLSLDPNRAAFGVAVMLYILVVDPVTRYRGRPRLTWLALALAALVAVPTFSRTGLFAWAAVVVVALVLLVREVGAKQVVIVVSACALIGVAAVAAVLVVGHIDLMRLLQERLSISLDDSGGHHFLLIGIGLDTLNQDISRWITGVGFGNSPAYLGDFFGGRDDGNFHSFYVTFLVEMGVMGLALALALTVAPLLRRGRRVLAISTVLFCVLYQAHLDGIFWLALAILWLMPTSDRGAHREGESESSPEGHRDEEKVEISESE